MTDQKQAICDALRAFIEQRPGFELCNYSTMRDYRSDYNRARRDLHVARTLLREVELSDSITAEAMLKECGGGRLQIVTKDKGGETWTGVDYCTGQYFCVEYRAAACRFLASALWTWTREQCMPAPGSKNWRPDTVLYAGRCYVINDKWVTGGDWLRANFRKLYGRTIAERFFS